MAARVLTTGTLSLEELARAERQKCALGKKVHFFEDRLKEVTVKLREAKEDKCDLLESCAAMEHNG